MAGGKRKAEEDLDRGDGYKNGPQTFGAPPTKAPDGKRKAECLTSVTALNTQFASWIERQKQERPLDLWRGGVQDYLRHAEKILSDFDDVVHWISSTSGQNGSITEPHKTSGVSASPDTKTQPAESSKGWGKFDTKDGDKSAANGATQEQGKPFAWSPVAKSGDPSTSQVAGGWKGGFTGLTSEKKDGVGFGGATAKEKSEKDGGGSALPGWGSGFDTGAKEGNDSEKKEKTGGESSAKEGERSSGFNFPTASASFGTEGPKRTSLFPALVPPSEGPKPASIFPSLVPPSQSAATKEAPNSALPTPLFATKEGPKSLAPTPLFAVPSFQPSTSATPQASGGPTTSGEVKTTGPPVTPTFSVPQFPIVAQGAPLPSIKTSVAPPVFDWAAGFSKPAPSFGGAPSFSLPGAKALAGGSQSEAGKTSAAEGDKKEGEDEGEGDTPSEPPSPSFKAAEEEGVENVLDTPVRVYRKAAGPDGAWEDQGTGSLMLKRDKGTPLKSKQANARVVFRNPGGKVLLNARLYVGMKLELQKNAVNAFLQTTETSTPVKGGDGEKSTAPVAEVVTRMYAFRRPKQGGMPAEELKAALERQVPNADATDKKA